MPRYAANLLFAFAVKSSRQRPLCEKRIVVFEASGARQAIRRAKRIGKHAEHSYKNVDDHIVWFEFIGLIDLINLEGCDENEAYYSMRRLKNPRSHVRADEQLSVFVSGTRAIGSAMWAVPKAAAARDIKRAPGRRPRAKS